MRRGLVIWRKAALAAFAVVASGCWKAAPPGLRPDGPYSGQGADQMYRLMPSLRGMRVAESDSETTSDSRWAQGAKDWHVPVVFCTTMTVASAERAVRADLHGKGFVERRDADGSLVVTIKPPPHGWGYAGVTIYEGGAARRLGVWKDSREGAILAVRMGGGH